MSTERGPAFIFSLPGGAARPLAPSVTPLARTSSIWYLFYLVPLLFGTSAIWWRRQRTQNLFYLAPLLFVGLGDEPVSTNLLLLLSQLF